MEDVIAVVITDTDGVEHGVLTWGRTFGPVEYDELIEAVRPKISSFGLSPGEGSLRVAFTLQEVAAMPYFHECLFDMQTTRADAIAENPALLESWLAHCREKILDGRYLWYLGDPRRVPPPRSA